MKFVTLALAVFLAVGCQAASLQADAPATLPSQLAHVRAVMKMYLGQMITSVTNILDKIEDQETKEQYKATVDEFHKQVLSLQEQAAPYTDGVVATIDEATMDLRTSISNDIEALKTELEPMHADLKEVVIKHIDDYKTMVQPLVDEYFSQAQMAAVKAKLEPLMADLQAKVAVNVEETKSKLVPIIEKVREKVATHVETLKGMINPYVQEYKEQLKNAMTQAKAPNVDEIREKLQPHAEKVKTSFENIINEIKNMMGQ